MPTRNAPSRLTVPALLLLACGFFCAEANCAAATVENLTIGWSAIAGSQAPFWITKEAGFFDKNGLDVTMIYVDGGSKATPALMTCDNELSPLSDSTAIAGKYEVYPSPLTG